MAVTSFALVSGLHAYYHMWDILPSTFQVFCGVTVAGYPVVFLVQMKKLKDIHSLITILLENQQNLQEQRVMLETARDSDS